ncbi:DUF1365 domain-containing protein, partial [Vibrio sp. 1865]|nr:DUF1365 domain-containing protein [Vibrio sp. 1865]
PFYSHPKYLASNERQPSSDKSDKKNNKHKENSAC